MSIFTLHSQVLADYRDFVRSFFLVADARARQFVEHVLDTEARLWPDFPDSPGFRGKISTH